MTFDLTKQKIEKPQISIRRRNEHANMTTDRNSEYKGIFYRPVSY